MTYYGYYATAEGTHNRGAYAFASLHKAAKDMRAIAYGNCLAGSTAKWTIQDSDGDVIKSGVIR